MQTNMTVAQLVTHLLENYNPLAKVNVSIENVLQVKIVPETEPRKDVVKPLFTDVIVAYAGDVEVGKLVYFTYSNSNKGPATRVGYVLENDGEYLLLEDLTVKGTRQFDYDYISDIHLLL